MTGLEAPDKLRLFTFLVVKDLPILELSKVNVVIEVLGCKHCPSSLDKSFYEESYDTEKAIFLFKEFDIKLCKVTLITLDSAFLDLALLNKRAHYSEFRVILALRLQVIAHLNLEKASQSVDRAHQKRRLLQSLHLRVKQSKVVDYSC